MTAPLTVNTNAEVEINDSCNCCLPFRRKSNKHNHIEKKVDQVYKKKPPVPGLPEKPKVKITRTDKKVHSDPTILMTTGEWIFEDIAKPAFQGYE